MDELLTMSKHAITRLEVNGRFKWQVPTAYWVAHWEVLPDSNVVLLEMDLRPAGPQGWIHFHRWAALYLKPKSPNPNPDWKQGALYQLLLAGAK